MNIVLLLAGNVMEPSSIVLIMAPILFPVAMKLGIDPIHLGIMMIVNMEIGMCHPPVGLNLYVASGITKMGITEAHDRRVAMAAHDARLPDHRHLLAAALDLATADARDDALTRPRRAETFAFHRLGRRQALPASQRRAFGPAFRFALPMAVAAEVPRPVPARPRAMLPIAQKRRAWKRGRRARRNRRRARGGTEHSGRQPCGKML